MAEERERLQKPWLLILIIYLKEIQHGAEGGLYSGEASTAIKQVAAIEEKKCRQTSDTADCVYRQTEGQTYIKICLALGSKRDALEARWYDRGRLEGTRPMSVTTTHMPMTKAEPASAPTINS